VSPPSAAAVRAVSRVVLTMGLAVRDTRTRRGWTMTDLARRAGVSVAAVHHVEAGRAASMEMYARLASALGLRLEASMVDPRRPASGRGDDPVHAAMGEVEVARLRARGVRVAVDEPYQHFQFAGRADVVAWDADVRALLHLENRTRFPNLQEAAGAFNAKRAYLGAALAGRLGLPPWRSETHVMVVAWTAEAIRDLRRSEASLRAICPDDPTGFEAWWRGEPPRSGRRAEIVIFDPVPAAALGRRRRWVDLDRALGTTPRHKGYATLADFLRSGQAGIGASR
jgi:transcriptional regulator with XRE-family HTH domain